MKAETLQITCMCGCGNGYIIRYSDEQYYIDLVEGYFVTRQSLIKGRIKEKIRLMGKNRWIGDCIVYEEDIKEMIGFLSRPCNHDKTENGAYLKASKVSESDEYNEAMFALELKCIMPRYQILLGKEYRCGELVLNENDRKRLVKRLKRALKMPAPETEGN